LKDALNIWGAEDEQDIQDLLKYLRDINKEIPVLEARYNRMIQLFEDRGIKNFKKFADQKITDKDEEFKLAEACIELAEEIPFRAQFDTYLKSFFDSLDLLFNTEAAKQYYIPAKRFGYLLVRIRNRYKDPTMDLKWAKPKIRKIIDKYLETIGINSKIPPVSLLSDDFQKEISKAFSAKTKASEMEHAIRRHIKVSLDKDPAFYKRFIERINIIMERYKGNWEQIYEEFKNIRDEIVKGRDDQNDFGLNKQEIPFYDLIVMNVFDKEIPNKENNEILVNLVVELVDKLQDAINKPNFWKQREAEIRKLQGEIDDMLDFSGIEGVSNLKERLSIEILSLAKKRHQELTNNR
jgi:type I restriction enzyme R subunit